MQSTPPRFPRVEFFYEIAGKPTLEIFRGMFFCQKYWGRTKFRVEFPINIGSSRDPPYISRVKPKKYFLAIGHPRKPKIFLFQKFFFGK